MTTIINISGKAKNGKDTFASILKDKLEKRGYKTLIIHQADYLKFVCKEYFGWNGEKDEQGRGILQFQGTDVGRERDPDIWVKVVGIFIDVFGREYDFVLIPDVRFMNEITYFINKYPVLDLRIIRQDFDNGLTEEQKNHKSETNLDRHFFDYEVITYEGLESVNNSVNFFLDWMREIYHNI